MNSNSNNNIQKNAQEFEMPSATLILFDAKDIITASDETWYPGQEEDEGIII